MARQFEFTQEQKEAIKKAVQNAESKTSGEIVPFFVSAADNYEESNLRAAIAFGIFALGSAAMLSFNWHLPFTVTPWEVSLFTLVMSGIGYLLSRNIDFIKKLFTTPELMQAKVEERAAREFLNHEVFNTENRTGILIMVSHFEHMVDVLGDSGINKKVESSQWQEVVKLIVEGIKNNDPTAGIINGINKCGDLLEASGVHKPEGNSNELSDDIRLG
ncbi:TPM domain-containing protein [Fulvivirga lutea]|uniref:TPM domain-containing protein n=1 Tax=Fulvivirga lutea TaxID=2810512 RepID=A0A974WJD6_9BACT|nr:TPM domain-containing protein [Fulvivirga lutea]QSE98237.1 TPM domain-containing protein [Fulvivirga lutea]